METKKIYLICAFVGLLLLGIAIGAYLVNNDLILLHRDTSPALQPTCSAPDDRCTYLRIVKFYENGSFLLENGTVMNWSGIKALI